MRAKSPTPCGRPLGHRQDAREPRSGLAQDIAAARTARSLAHHPRSDIATANHLAAQRERIGIGPPTPPQLARAGYEDGKCQLTVANLVTCRTADTTGRHVRQLSSPSRSGVAVHAPVPDPFGDEGAANHMPSPPAQRGGLEIFVYAYRAAPSRTPHVEESKAVARTHALVPPALFVEQNPEAIAAGAFHTM